MFGKKSLFYCVLGVAAWIFLVMCLLSVLFPSELEGSAVYGPTEFWGDVSVGTWSAVSNLNAVAGYNVNGAFSAGTTYTNYYRVGYTNSAGRSPTSVVEQIIFTASSTTNIVTLHWELFYGGRAYVVEKSLDGGTTWTNWTTVHPQLTNWIDYGTNTYIETDWEAAYSVIPNPTVPWGGSGGTPIDSRPATGTVDMAGFSVTNGVFYGDGAGLTNVTAGEFAGPWTLDHNAGGFGLSNLFFTVYGSDSNKSVAPITVYIQDINSNTNGMRIGLYPGDGNFYDRVNLYGSNVLGGVVDIHDTTGNLGTRLTGNSDSYIASGGSFGLGTNDPSDAKLYVYNDGNTLDMMVRDFAPDIQFAETGGSQDFFMGVDASAFRLGTGGLATASFFMDANGDIGIRTASPSETFHVNGNSYMDGTISMAATLDHIGDADTELTFGNDFIRLTAGGINFIDIDETSSPRSVLFGNGSTEIDFYFYDSSGETPLFIDGSSSSVGVRTNIPAAALHVNGDCIIESGLVANGTTILSNDLEVIDNIKVKDTSGNTDIELAADGTSYFWNDVAVGINAAADRFYVMTDTDNEGISLVGATGDDLFRAYRSTLDHGVASVHDSSENENIRLHSLGNSWFTGGNLGVGTNAPATDLHIYNSTVCEHRITGGTEPRIMFEDVNNSFDIYLQNNGLYFSIGTSTTERTSFTINQEGHIGIGTNDAPSPLTIHGDGTASDTAQIEIRNVNAAGQSRIEWHTSDGQRMVAGAIGPSIGIPVLQETGFIATENGYEMRIASDGNTASGGSANVVIGAGGYDSADITIDGATGLVTIEDDLTVTDTLIADSTFHVTGTQVGIGTNSPAAKLHVVGDTILNGEVDMSTSNIINVGDITVSGSVNGTATNSTHLGGTPAADYATETEVAISAAGNTNITSGLSLQRQSTFITNVAGTVYFETEKIGGGDLNYFFRGSQYDLDCTTGSGIGGRARIALTAGTDTSPSKNYVYVSTNGAGTAAELFASTTHPGDASVDPYGMVAVVNLQSAATTLADGPLTMQRWSDTISHSGRSRPAFNAERIRQEGARWVSGGVGSVQIDTATSPDSVFFSMTSGIAYQLHRQAFSSMAITNGATPAYVINHPTTAYLAVTNLNQLTVDADGDTLTGRHYALRVYLFQASGDDGVSRMFINLPTGSYVSSTGAEADSSAFDVKSIPEQLLGGTINIGRIVLRNSGGGSTYTLTAYQSTLGELVNATGSGSGAAAQISSFDDANFSVYDADDATRIGAFDLGSITTGNTRTLTWPNSSGQMVLGTGTANTITKWSSDGVLADSLLTDTGTNVGLGTNDPQQRLHIVEDKDGISTLCLQNDGDGTANVVGALLQVKNNLGYWAGLGITSTGSTIQANSFSNTMHLYNQGFADSLYTVDGAEDHVWYTDPFDTHDFGALSNEVMRLTYEGKLGIGDPTPDAELDVNGHCIIESNLTVNGTITGISYIIATNTTTVTISDAVTGTGTVTVPDNCDIVDAYVYPTGLVEYAGTFSRQMFSGTGMLRKWQQGNTNVAVFSTEVLNDLMLVNSNQVTVATPGNLAEWDYIEIVDPTGATNQTFLITNVVGSVAYLEEDSLYSFPSNSWVRSATPLLPLSARPWIGTSVGLRFDMSATTTNGFGVVVQTKNLQ